MQDFERIFVPVDGSEYSEHALDKAISLAKLLDRPLIALYVIDAAHVDPFPRRGAIVDLEGLLEEEADRVLGRVREAARKHGIEAGTLVLHGHPEEEVVKAVQPKDLLVLGSRGRRGLSRFLLGSVAENVVRHAPCPVLVVRRPADD